MAFEDPVDVQDPDDGEDILTAWGDIVNQDLLALYGPPRVRARRSTVQSIPDDALTLVEFDIGDLNLHGLWDVGDPGHIKFGTAGWEDGANFIYGANIRWENSTDGSRRYAEIRVNDAIKIVDSDGSIASSGFASNQLTDIWAPITDDTFSLYVYQDTGHNLNIEPDGYSGITLWAAWQTSFDAG